MDNESFLLRERQKGSWRPCFNKAEHRENRQNETPLEGRRPCWPAELQDHLPAPWKLPSSLAGLYSACCLSSHRRPSRLTLFMEVWRHCCLVQISVKTVHQPTQEIFPDKSYQTADTITAIFHFMLFI